MAEQWEEEQTLEEIMERIRMAGSSFQLDAMQRVPKFVVNEHMLQGKREKFQGEKENTRMVY